jgi:asparagine synthase (glutamine-hydrolysing)
MCGVTGFWSLSEYDNENIAMNMANQIASRGPDYADVWSSKSDGFAMAHRRLAIVDLSPSGNQPMISSCNRYILAYNGEIYNHLDIRKLLQIEQDSIEWLGMSDTETLLVAICHWGLEKTLQKINGMFAFSLWDSHKKNLYLARDRIGEKPMYYGISNDTFFFGSQLKSFIVHPSWNGEVDRESLSLYMKYGYIPAPCSIYNGISKLEPAHFIVIKNGGKDISKPKSYWSIDNAENPAKPYTYKNDEDVVDDLENLLISSIKQRMVADVPLGAFLSGGIDSSSVVALMQSLSKEPIKTFSIGFNEENYNEANHARKVAEHLGTDHTELYVSPSDTISALSSVTKFFDEPFADPSQIPTLLVSELAKSKVTVSLSGDGGDELFYGYSRYSQANALWNKLRLIPLPIRKLASLILANIPLKILNFILGSIPLKFQPKHFKDRVLKFTQIIDAPNWLSFYDRILSQGNHPRPLVINKPISSNFLKRHKLKLEGLPSYKKMMYVDMMMYLPDDILAKVDRASMAFSLEARVPFLDHRLVEFAWNTSFKYKFRKNTGKWLLRELLYRHVPKKLIDRPKMGFSVPVEDWLRGPLRELADELFDEKKLAMQGFFDPILVSEMWNEHKKNERRWHAQLWRLLIFQLWLTNDVSLEANKI